MHRWSARLRQAGPVGLNELSRRPKKFRQPVTPWEVVVRVVQLRRRYPAWSKYKLKVLLAREKLVVSASTIGRILKRRGLIDHRVSRKRRKAALHPRLRFSKGMRIAQPGQLLQLDTKHIMLVGGKRFYQFTAIDVLTKRRVMRVYPSESSRNGALFLKECLAGFPYPLSAVQTDNGSTWLKEFDKLCKELGLPHYFIYPRTPKQNTYVEISHQADEREFYRQGNVTSIFPEMQRLLFEWEKTWNTIRPHEALSQLTPDEYCSAYWQKGRFLNIQPVVVLQA